MKCPFCSHNSTSVTNSRPFLDKKTKSSGTRRRRECPECNRRFTSLERTEEPQRMVLKRSGEKAPYSREKLHQSVRKACTRRPVSSEKLWEMVYLTEHCAFENGCDDVPTQDLGELVLDQLRSIDKVAYLRFSSVFHRYDNLEDFERELKELRELKPKANGAG